MAADLVKFAQSAQVAATYVDSADQQSAVDLAAARSSVEDLRTISQNTQGDQNYDAARNAQGRGNHGATTVTGDA